MTKAKPKQKPSGKPPMVFTLADFTEKSYKMLSIPEQMRIRSDLKKTMNLEGQTIEDLAADDAIFVLFPTGWMAFTILTHRTGRELFLNWIDGKDLFPNQKILWEYFQALRDKCDCRFIGATMRRRAAQRIFANWGVKYYPSFTHDKFQEEEENAT